MRSSNRLRGIGPALLIASALTLGACNRAVDVNSPEVRGIGYIRLDDVLKKHPLYAQLAQIDSNIDALSLRSLAPAVPKTGAQLARETTNLNRELEAARERANHVLQQRQSDYARREKEAVDAAIAASGESVNSAPGQSMQNAANAQASAVSAQANADFAQYQQAVLAQDRAAVDAVSRQISLRADRQYRQKAEQLTAQESQVSLEYASRDSAQRLALRTKLNNLALDDASRAQVKSQLEALDRRESRAVAAMRAQDLATLSAYQRQLRQSTNAEVARQAAAIHQQTQMKLQSRHNTVASQVNSQIGTLPVQQGAGLSPGTQARIAQIQKEYRARFQADVNKTIADFNRTRTDLDARFGLLHGVDATAQGSVAKQLDALHKQRDRLYNQMVAQVEREVSGIAKRRGLRVVFDRFVTPAGGVDLTDEAEKDVESLHE